MRKKLKWIIPLAVLLLLAAAFFIYVSIYYHADAEALAALEPTETVTVSETDYGWFFDGPGETDALIFYPGAKVEAPAYAPLLHRLAAAGMDACLVKMPFNLAIFGIGKAEKIMTLHDYENWYIGGHSLGGAMAARFAADHTESLKGVILFAAYTTKTLEEPLTVLSIFGSEDGVLNMDKVAEGRALVCGEYKELVIEGGNHARFGSYGEQKGDGKATIGPAEQWDRTVEFIIESTEHGS